jgi:hypothetical protein
MTTFANLSIGTIIVYVDQSNPHTEFVVLDTFTNQFGTFVNLMNLECRTIAPEYANNKLDSRWTIS